MGRARLHARTCGEPAPAEDAFDLDADFDRMDTMLAPHVATLGAAVANALIATPDDDALALKAL